MNVARDEISVLFDHEKLYHIESFENEAHSIIEKWLIQEFIASYMAHSDLSDPQVQYQIGIFYS
jgi:hypothetical protein